MNIIRTYKLAVPFICSVLLVGLNSCGSDHRGSTETEQTQGNDAGQSKIAQPSTAAPSNDSELSNHTGVKVSLPNFGESEWNQFRAAYPQSSVPVKNTSAGTYYQEASPWQEWGNYSYQQVFLYHGQSLWIQTLLKEKKDNPASDQTQEPRILTKREADSLKISNLWNKMEDLKLHLEDSLNSTVPTVKK